MHAPTQTHMEATYRVLRYLNGCPGKEILYQKHGHHKVMAYTDADWDDSISDRRSTSGYCTLVGGNLVTWQSKKQMVVTRSRAEAEFRSMENSICELL